MNLIKYPDRKSWSYIIARPVMEAADLDDKVRFILDNVRQNGDTALREYNRQFEKYYFPGLQVNEQEVRDAYPLIDQELKDAIELASKNIRSFHSAQLEDTVKKETSPGVLCWRENRPIEKVGLYIPGGSAPLFSSILMLAIPAALAECDEVIMCTPPGKDGNINPALLYTASLCGIKKIYKVGGAQAIAAMAYGTETIPAVYKVFGPGNQYVTRAKEQTS